MMVLVVDPSCIPSRLNVGGLSRVWKVEELPLKEASECGLARDSSQYLRISGSVLAQQFYTTARRCFRRFVIGVRNGMTGRAVISLNRAPLCPALTRHGVGDRLGEMVFHFGSALAARGVLTDLELGKLVLQYLKRKKKLKN